MIQSAEKYPVSDLFGIDKDVKYIVPKYQREFVWNKQNWEKLFDDIWENDKGHFLGSIICVNKNKDALAITELELIDGQQRFTTISLLYCAIYYILRNEITESNRNEEIQNESINLKYRIIQKSNRDILKVEPSYQRNNFNDYLYILDELEIKRIDVQAPHVGNRRLYKAYSYFYARLMEKDGNGKSVFTVDEIINFLSKLNGALLVKIEVNTHSDAFTLFETINNTGVKLTAIDLIKNNILSQMEKKGKSTIDEAFFKWKHLIENLPDDPSYQERFLRHYYNAFKHKPDYKIEKISRAMRSNLIGIYDRLIENDVESVFNDLYSKSKIYGMLVNSENGKFSETIHKKLFDLDNIGAAPAYSFLLYLFSEFQNEEKYTYDILDLLVKYFVRRNLTDVPPTRELDKIFIDLIEKFETNKSNRSIEPIIQYLMATNKFASDEIFCEKLNGNIYEENYSVTRFILTKIEEAHNKTKELFTDFWKKNKSNNYIWTIEHIFPQGSNVPQSWIDMIAKGDKELATQYLDKYVHKFGNLTLTGYNQKLSNLSFIDKRDRIDKNGNYVGYKNGLFLNKSLAKKNSWDIQDIEDRTNYLVNNALDLFSLSKKN